MSSVQDQYNVLLVLFQEWTPTTAVKMYSCARAKRFVRCACNTHGSSQQQVTQRCRRYPESSWMSQHHGRLHGVYRNQMLYNWSENYSISDSYSTVLRGLPSRQQGTENAVSIETARSRAFLFRENVALDNVTSSNTHPLLTSGHDVLRTAFV